MREEREAESSGAPEFVVVPYVLRNHSCWVKFSDLVFLLSSDEDRLVGNTSEVDAKQVNSRYREELSLLTERVETGIATEEERNMLTKLGNYAKSFEITPERFHYRIQSRITHAFQAQKRRNKAKV